MAILSVSLCLGLGVVTRISSYLDLAQQTQRRRWRHLWGLKAALSDDTLEYVTERMKPQDWRQNQAEVVKKLKDNKGLESGKIKGLLFLSVDANDMQVRKTRAVGIHGKQGAKARNAAA